MSFHSLAGVPFYFIMSNVCSFSSVELGGCYLAFEFWSLLHGIPVIYLSIVHFELPHLHVSPDDTWTKHISRPLIDTAHQP